MKNSELYMQSVSNNEYGIPDIPKQTFKKVPENLCASAYGAKTKYPALVHFFIEDRRFESVWTHPVRSLNKLTDEKTWAVCSPDFSMYADAPYALQLYQVWRSRVLNKFWAENGIKVIPTIMFSNKKSLEYSFLGIPKKQILALSVPSRATSEELLNFRNGYIAMLEFLEPSIILCFGSEIDIMSRDNVDKIYFPKGHFNQKGFLDEQERR